MTRRLLTPPTNFFSKPYLGSAEKVFPGGRVWGVGCGVWGFTGFEGANYLIFREKVQEFSP
ncbi:hypothetical protein RVR34_26780 [Microcystis aeruginosa FBCC-A68]|nr:hypothetical protein [Microcystis aeruginosa]